MKAVRAGHPSASPGAVARGRRLAILCLLAEGPRSAEALAGALGTSPRAVVRHLRLLAASGLVRQRDEVWSLDGAAVAGALARLVASGPPLGEVAPPPEECLLCRNRGYVLSLVAELARSLNEARQQHERLRQLSAQAMRAQEEERRRVARELHDDTAQALTALLMKLRALERSFAHEEGRRELEELRALVSHTLEGVRRLAADLRPSTLDDLGLPAATTAYVQQFARIWGLPVHLRVDRLEGRLAPDVELAVYRVLQEALANVAKHSGASQAWVSLGRRRGALVLTVRDDGRGFDVAAVLRDRERGLGLFGMQERMALVGGSLRVRSRPGEGTAVVARVPLPAEGDG